MATFAKDLTVGDLLVVSKNSNSFQVSFSRVKHLSIQLLIFKCVKVEYQKVEDQKVEYQKFEYQKTEYHKVEY